MEDILKLLKGIQEEADFENSKNFIEDGLLDSLDIMTLVEGLEKAYHIDISGKDIVPENFCDLQTIEALVKKNGGKL